MCCRGLHALVAFVDGVRGAYDVLRTIATTQHPLKSQADLDVYHYLYDQLEDINRTGGLANTTSLSNQLIFETPRSAVRTIQANATPTESRRCSDYEDIVNTTQIVVRVPGALPSSVLLTAHFDSAPLSFGASDDGAGVAVILETLRALVASPAQLDHSLVVFLDNGEEAGLCGSKWFVQSGLADMFKVKVFVNVEGGGAGGRAILFRSTDDQLAALYSQVAPYPHMNSLGGTLIGLLHSDTDYSTYERAAIPGIDIAFYEHRELYHTLEDSTAHISASDIQHCGENVLAITRALLDTNSLDDWVSDGHALYFDLMGRWGFPLPVATRWLVLAIVWLAAFGVVAVHFHAFPLTSQSTMGAFFRCLVSDWLYFATALGVGCVFALLANFPLVGFILVTSSPLLSWTVLPNAVVGLVFGNVVATVLWRRRQGIVQPVLPPTMDWMHLATAGSTFGAFLCTFFPLNVPLLYLFPITTLAYSIVLLLAMAAALAVQVIRRRQSYGLLWKAGTSYTSIPNGRASDTARPAIPLSVFVSLVATFVGFLAVSLPVAVDNLWMMQSVGGNDPFIMSAVPLVLAPSLFMVLPWLAACDAKDGLVLVLLYLIVWAIATVQYAAST
ncbi:hypothetical protein DYB32_008927 [Aphanomyces invadans]|uniref:Vacuolar membrane protease n=1 Tax=Aphanomyces invadans TaxID=157072 RepID=A0A418AJU4_9STRA|nr:hypothetical protein DYB32_008927 [Aphanomyces invadans]